MMRTMKYTVLGLVAFAVSLLPVVAKAADVSNTLGTAGAWSETVNTTGDVTNVVKMAQITAGVSTTARLVLPANVIASSVTLEAYPVNNLDGVTVSKIEYPTLASFKLTGGTTSYSDLVSQTISMGSVSGTTMVSSNIPIGMAGIVVTGGSTLSTSEVIQLRLRYTVPNACRWPKC